MSEEVVITVTLKKEYYEMLQELASRVGTIDINEWIRAGLCGYLLIMGYPVDIFDCMYFDREEEVNSNG